MSTNTSHSTDTDRPDADVIPLYGNPDTRPDTTLDTRPDSRADTASTDDADNAGHFDVALDDEPSPGGAPVDTLTPGGLPADAMTGGGLRPVIPANLQGWQNIKATVREGLIQTGHVVGFHAVRAPWYTAQVAFWAVVGVFVLTGRQLRWWWLTEQYTLRQMAAQENDPQTWVRLHREVKATRRWRFIVLCAQALTLGIGGPILWTMAPTWVLGIVLGGAALLLAQIGRPADRSIVTKAVVTGRYRRVNPDIVLRAYYAAGLGHPDKPGQQITFGSPMSRDVTGSGSQVSIDLPYGKGFGHALNAREAIASGLDVSINQVFLTRDNSSHRRHTLFVADRDPLAVPAGRTPLLDGKIRDIWTPAPFGLDERGRKVLLDLMWISILIGAQPRKGKTFAARVLALFAALDPYVRILLVDGKNSPDWDKFRMVVHRAVFGTVPNARDTDPVTHLVEVLTEVKKHIEDVNEFLSKLPTSECPEGKITRELSRKYPTLRVWMLIMEEFQVYYELDDQNANKEIAALLSFIMAVGPSAGVIILSSSQKPSGVGAGDVARIFNRYRDNHAVRFALKCGNRVVSEAVLGGDAYAEGFDASALPTGKQYRGVGILYGASDDTSITRTYLADHTDAEKILTAARRHRVAAGTLSGLAAGEQAPREVRDVLADVRSIFTATEPGLHWQHIADRLAETYPEHYGDISPDAISAQLRALKLRSVNVKVSGETLKGVRLDAIDTAITDRQATRTPS
jgi:S-DNA-T family DNA segregation ATPase FtsK/SpoIIIE